ncbi:MULTISPECIES: HlyD family efflux transporter periplasmic adaptor subunit [unclassified Nodularia (in: cyanobacteria)]|uniref:HlyD family efflux transporter periplasmic adaptor subunit n=1 Tax=unclassified Nodularia (in: cyanobacteria) TaxID=2656917 RepID=UPI00187FDA64|nr:MULTISPECIES: HlyD family efflux transporter periplasmic adaptor subunit [unclassified Nodularia (in: cyanobacteria)]MBE9200595.1 HlyD family efflux transporter periplasmic adaptor subunit [Nodularia sp. LEGE 06071]MCC2692501.1 HlyD family efflux transporter periplasmic adaptor subunit [Nodularia sp. LEGE 04288]
MLYTHSEKILPAVRTEDFLPPVSIWMSLAAVSLMGTVVSGVALASLVQYNVTVKTAATVRPAGEVRLVQPQTEGIVENILVQENQIVKEGDVIARLDSEELQIIKSQLQGNLQQNYLQLIQINAQIDSLDTQIMAEERVIKQTVFAAESDLARNQRDYQERQVATQNQLQAAQAELRRTQAELLTAHAVVAQAEKESARYEGLAKSGVVSFSQYEQKALFVDQTKSTLVAAKEGVQIAETKVRIAQSAIDPSQATVEIAENRIDQEAARGEATIATLKKEKQALTQRRVDMQNQLNQLQKELQQVQNKLQGTIIRATSDGIIFKLNLRNPGQVVRASEPVAEIVPQNAPLEIKAMIPTGDIQKVEVGQEVILRVDACPYPDYGTLKAVVSNISPDVMTIPGNSTGAAATAAASFFEATVQPETMTFGNGDRQCRIQSGMNTKADIISKQETALQFVLRRARLMTDL